MKKRQSFYALHTSKKLQILKFSSNGKIGISVFRTQSLYFTHTQRNKLIAAVHAHNETSSIVKKKREKTIAFDAYAMANSWWE